MIISRNLLKAAAGLGLTFACGHADVFDDIKPGTWVMLPCKNTIESVAPNPEPEGNSGTMSVVEKWNSGAYDTKRDRLIVWGGGHTDYKGNELYVFDLKALTWQRLTDPSATPTAVHTYDALEYLPLEDRFWAQGGSTWPSGSGTDATWTFDFVSKKWESKKDHPSGWGLGNVTAYDPMSGNVIWDGDGNNYNDLHVFDPVANTWTERGADSYGNYQQTGVLDVKKRKFVRIGAGELDVYDISKSGSLAPVKMTTTGGADIEAKEYPGIEYDPVSEKLLAWSGGQTVYQLALDTKKWTATVGQGADPGVQAERGTFNRWRYVPSKNIFIIVNSIDKNVYAYRHTAPLSAPSWYTTLLTTGVSNINRQGRKIDMIGGNAKPIFQNSQVILNAVLLGDEQGRGSLLAGKDCRGRSIQINLP